MRILLAGIMLLLAAGAMAGQPRLTNEEYRIYGVVLTDFFRELNRQNGEYAEKHFLIAHETMSGNKKGRVRLERRFPVAFSYSIVDEQEILRWAEQDVADYRAEQEKRRKEGKPLVGAECGPGWRRFQTRYPESNGYYQLSRITFSRNHRLAYLDVVAEGGTWGTSATYRVKWTKRGWKVYRVGGGSNVC